MRRSRSGRVDLPSSQPRRRGFELTAAEWSSRASGGAERGAADLAVAELLRFGREERENGVGERNKIREEYDTWGVLEL